MLRIFQRNMVMQAAIILAVWVALWIGPLLTPTPMEAGDHPALLYGLLCNWLSGVLRLAVVLAMLLSLGEGIWLNLLLANAGLTPQNSLLPTLLFVVATGVGATTLNPALLATAAAIGSLGQLMLHGTLLTIPPSRICGATVLIGLATLFYLPAVALVLTYLLVAANYRLYGWRDWALMILGFLAPYVPIVVVLFLDDGLQPWWQHFVAGLGALEPQAAPMQWFQLMAALLLAIVLVWSIVHVNMHRNEHPVVWRSNASSVMLFAIGSLGASLYSPLSGSSLALFAIPFSFCCTLLLLGNTSSNTWHNKRRREWIYDIILVLVIVAAFVC